MLAVKTAPVPGPLVPLFATGLGVLGLLGWRRKRKANGFVLTKAHNDVAANKQDTD